MVQYDRLVKSALETSKADFLFYNTWPNLQTFLKVKNN